MRVKYGRVARASGLMVSWGADLLDLESLSPGTSKAALRAYYSSSANVRPSREPIVRKPTAPGSACRHAGASDVRSDRDRQAESGPTGARLRPQYRRDAGLSGVRARSAGMGPRR